MRCLPRSVTAVSAVVAAVLTLGGGVAAVAAPSDPGSPRVISPEPTEPGAPPAPPGQAKKVIPGHYIVTLKDGASPRGVLRRHALPAKATYAHALRGFAARLNARQLLKLHWDPDVLAVEVDQIVTMDTTQNTTTGTWGLDRVDQRRVPLSNSYYYRQGGSGVTAWVIDSGIYARHPQFGTRAAVAFDAFGGNGDDCNGHGTHVAGTIGAATHGIAKQVRLRAVKVLDCNGSGSLSGVIKGVDFVRSRRSGPTVANLSLSSGRSTALDSAVTNLVNSGVAVSVAAGNSSVNACNVSPAAATNVLTVAAVDRGDRHASFSNYGSCVELYAPGVNIQSTWRRGETGTLSGTSMASPHVAGILALRLTNGATSPWGARTWVLNNVTTGVVIGEPLGTPDRAVFKSSL